MLIEKLLNVLLDKRQQQRNSFFEGVHPINLEKVFYALGRDQALTEEIVEVERLLKGTEE